ncbi:MAG: alpha-amylase [Bacteroidales bacterium]|nr:alpha-amylase [Bacteroidales bacterium]
MKKLFLIVFAAAAMVLTTACGGGSAQGNKTGLNHAGWTYNSVVYEMNLRQYTAEGTLEAAADQLPRLQRLGVDVLWLMPIHPIGVEGRKGTLGSYYAPQNYREVNPEFGTLEDFDAFLAAAHEQGFKVILDWVANHTSPDAVWISTEPEDWYVRDEKGDLVIQYDWTDIAKLNYDNSDMAAEMEDCMRFWLDRGVDGFRCDVAGEMPDEFWGDVLPKLRKDYPDTYYLAEGEREGLYEDGFDASYAWELHHLMNDIAQGKKGAQDLRDYVERDAARYEIDGYRLMFTSNHDENSWSGTEFERMGDAVKAMAVLTFTLPYGQPLIYTGQEMAYDHRFEFFEKDNVPFWEWNEWSDFYQKLIALKHGNAALDAGGLGKPLEWLDVAAEGRDGKSLLAFRRGNVTVIANLSNLPVAVKVPFTKKHTEYFSGRTFRGPEKEPNLAIGPWGYWVFTDKLK